MEPPHRVELCLPHYERGVPPWAGAWYHPRESNSAASICNIEAPNQKARVAYVEPVLGIEPKSANLPSWKSAVNLHRLNYM